MEGSYEYIEQGGGPPAWGLGVGLTTPHRLLRKFTGSLEIRKLNYITSHSCVHFMEYVQRKHENTRVHKQHRCSNKSAATMLKLTGKKTKI
jgi:hypothetical protein